MNRVQLKNLSKSQLKGNWKTPVLIILVYFLILFVISSIQENCISSTGLLISFLISLVFEVWGFVGLSNFFLKFIEKDGKSTFKDTLVSKNVLLKSFGFTILITIVGAILGLIIGLSIVWLTFSSVFYTSGYLWISILLLIALTVIISIISLAVSMTSYILIEKEELGLFKAIGLSINMMKGHKWELFVIQLSFIGWAILCLLTFGIGFLWLTPYITLTTTNYYKELCKENDKLLN
ncbi:MAG: DUF975 family protein [Romboutsia sp.]